MEGFKQPISVAIQMANPILINALLSNPKANIKHSFFESRTHTQPYITCYTIQSSSPLCLFIKQQQPLCLNSEMCNFIQFLVDISCVNKQSNCFLSRRFYRLMKKEKKTKWETHIHGHAAIRGISCRNKLILNAALTFSSSTLSFFGQ